jgi:hypothetical protein
MPDSRTPLFDFCSGKFSILDGLCQVAIIAGITLDYPLANSNQDRERTALFFIFKFSGMV